MEKSNTLYGKWYTEEFPWQTMQQALIFLYVMKMCLVHDLPFDPSKSILFAIKVSKWRITKKKKKKQNGHSTKQRVVTLDPWGQLIFKQLFLNKFVLDQMDFWRLREQSVCNQTNSHPYFLIEKHWSSWMTYFKPDKQAQSSLCLLSHGALPYLA